VKILLTILASVGLCSCELAPGTSDESLNQSKYVPAAAIANPGLANPRTYMDGGDPNIQKLMSSRQFQ
jgi:hypothetical protein